MGKDEKAVRLSLTVPPRTMEALQMLADERDVSVAWVMRWMMDRGMSMEAIVSEDGKVYGENAQGQRLLLADASGDYLSGSWRPRLPERRE